MICKEVTTILREGGEGRGVAKGPLLPRVEFAHGLLFFIINLKTYEQI